MSGLNMEVTLSHNRYVELCEGRVKFWDGEGLPNYEGTLEGFSYAYPESFQELVKLGIVKKIDKNQLDFGF